MSCKGLHCGGCGDGGGGGLLPLVIVVVIVAACAGPVVHAVTDLVEIVAVMLAGLLAVGVVVAVVVWRVRRRRVAVMRPARPVVLAAVREPAGLDGRRAPAAIEAPRSRVSAYPRIDVSPHVVTSRAARLRCARRDERRS